MKFIARRQNENTFGLFSEGYEFGKLIVKDFTGVLAFESEDKVLESRVRFRMGPLTRNVKAALGGIRMEYIRHVEEMLEESRIEYEAEMREQRAREFACWDPEAQADLELHNFMHPDGYR